MRPANTSIDIELRPGDPEGAAALSCLKRYYAELATLIEGGFDPTQQAYAGTSGETPPVVYCVLAWRGEKAVGCGFLQWHEGARVVEIKRMWVAEDARGRGLARAILAHLEDKARKEDFAFIRLDTNRVLTGAQTLYRNAGYSDIARYSANPYAHHWFGKQL